MINYTEKKADFKLSLLAVDATDKAGISNMFKNIGQDNLGGCALSS